MSRTRKRGEPALPMWYSDGLQFECQPDCGRCCTNHDDYAYVYLDGDDATNLADHLGLTPGQFKSQHTEVDDGDLVLRMDPEQEDCPFLEGAACTIYEARPTQCRTFPFWTENLRSPKRWRKLSQFCPGIDRGPLHDRKKIERLADERDR